MKVCFKTWRESEYDDDYDRYLSKVHRNEKYVAFLDLNTGESSWVWIFYLQSHDLLDTTY